MEQPQVGWAQTFDPTATAVEPTAAHPYYTLPFSDPNQRDIDFSNLQTNFVVTTAGTLQTTETGFTASFTVVLSSRPTSDVTIPVSSSDPSEGTRIDRPVDLHTRQLEPAANRDRDRPGRRRSSTATWRTPSTWARAPAST